MAEPTSFPGTAGVRARDTSDSSPVRPFSNKKIIATVAVALSLIAILFGILGYCNVSGFASMSNKCAFGLIAGGAGVITIALFVLCGCCDKDKGFWLFGWRLGHQSSWKENFDATRAQPRGRQEHRREAAPSTAPTPALTAGDPSSSSAVPSAPTGFTTTPQVYTDFPPHPSRDRVLC